jgi:hypothetical protein
MRRALWLLIITPPLLLWLVLAVLTLSHVPNQVHSGDAFIDAYAQLQLKQGGLIKPEPSHVSLVLAEMQWRALEKQFSNDPRFWWLCYKRRNGDTGTSDPPSENYLVEARHRGIATLPILLVLYTSVSKSYDSKVEYSPGFKDFANKSGQGGSLAPGDYSIIVHARREAIDRLHDDTMDLLLEEMQVCAPQHPLPYYLQAMLAGERRQYDKAYGLLKQGNSIGAAAKSDHLVLTDMYDPISIRQLKTRDAPLAKLISGQSRVDFDGIGAFFQWDAEALAVDAFQLERMDLVTEIHKMGCYTGIATDYDWLPTKIGLQALLHIQKEAASQPALAADSGKAAALSKLQRELYAAYSYRLDEGASLLQVTPHHKQLLQYRAAFDSRIEAVIDAASNGYYAPADRVLNINPDPLFQSYLLKKPGLEVCKAELDKMYAGLLRFDYTTCSFHDPPAFPAR